MAIDSICGLLSPRHAISSEKYVEFLQSYGSKYIIGGDWNAKHTQWGARLITPKGRNLLEAMNRRTNVLA
jgi:hypothetical protein